MSYFHVVAYFEDAPQKLRCLFDDLSEQELRDRFVKPYRKGKDVLSDSEIVKLASVHKVQIVRTNRVSEAERKDLRENSSREIDEMNRRGGPVIVSAGRGYEKADIVEVGDDVTSEYIGGPPGYQEASRIRRLMYNPWVLAIIPTLLVAWMIYWLGWGGD